jgi:predicted dehydrogenase
MSYPLHVAVVGSGIGAEHIQGFSHLPDLFHVSTLCDLNPERARKVADAYGIEKIEDDFETVCRRSDIDIIDLCTPPNLHFEQIMFALRAGKKVICEKPLVGNLQQIDTIGKAEAESGVRVMPIFQYRYGRGLQKLKYLVDRQLTGEPFVFNVEVAWWRDAVYYDNPWRGRRATELGGALLSQAIHALDMVLYVLGPAKSVRAKVNTRVNDIEVEDCVAMSIEMANGSLGVFSVTLGSAEQISRHRFTFRNVVAESNREPYKNSSDPWTFIASTHESTAQLATTLEQVPSSPEGYAGQFYRYYEALRNGTQLPVTLDDARATLELIAATYHSSETGQSVELPIGPNHPKFTQL